MQLIIKVLKGSDCLINASPTTSILEIKEEIQKILSVSTRNQKLLLLGRTLNDNLPVSAYPNIKDGTKLNLIIMKSDTLEDVMRLSFRKYFNESHADNLAKEFIIEFENKLNDMSLDDLERVIQSLTCLKNSSEIH